MSKKEELFNYSEEPIKKWISAITGIEYDKLYSEAPCETKGIVVTSLDNKKYNVFLSNSKNPGFCLTKDEFEDDENLRRAVSLLYESVYTTYVLIAKCIEYDWGSSDNSEYNPTQIMPFFDQDTFRFSPSFVNKLGLERNNIFKKLKEVELKILNKNYTDNNKITVFTEKATLINKAMAITDKMIEDEQKKCLEKNQKQHPYLYISCVRYEQFGNNLIKF